MSYVLMIPAQVWFLMAAGALVTLLGDAAVRSWRSPERVADPSVMWPRWAPVISDWLIGPRLPGGEFRMPEAGLRLAWGPGGSFFEDVAAHPVPRPPAVVPGHTLAQDNPELDVEALREAFRQGLDGRRAALLSRGSWVETEPASEPVTVDPVHVGATEEWSPLDEHEAATAARLPLDDVEEWLAARVRQYEHELSRISCRTVSLVKGETQRTLDDELQAFVDGSQQLHAYREMRIGSTQELGSRAMLRELLRV